ncbi:MAG: HEAT repeat domain-containing protein [Desulfovibrio sp.]|nr:HEAT repeat domain-containing protein [Desulfovibrio sp.]MBI4959750.1 HEAT repeat domain-containing protein [Desulfovibrio sp.]
MSKLKERRKGVLEALSAEPWPSGLAGLDAFPAKPLIGALFACLLEPDQLIRWRAASAFGHVAKRLFAHKPEDARQLMRQFMWRLNEESGNIAWGIPESFGEILAAQPVLASEFHRVLASYINDRDCKTGDNYLELCALRRGVYWGLARLAQDRPELVLPALDDLLLALKEEDPESRGLAARALGFLLKVAGARKDEVREKLAGLGKDYSEFDLYANGSLNKTTVADAAQLKVSP